MITPNYNKGELLYNIVFGIIEYNSPHTVVDYDSMYNLISPFILTKEIFEAGVKPTQPIVSFITKQEEKKDTIKELQQITDFEFQNKITICTYILVQS